MNREEYLLSEFGIEIEREYIAKKIKEIMQNKDEKGFKENLNKLLQKLEKIEKGDMETIRFVWRKMDNE